MIKVTCPRCESEYTIEEISEPVKVECEECGLSFKVNPPKRATVPPKPPPVPTREVQAPPVERKPPTGFGPDANAIAARGRMGDMYIVVQVVLTEKLLGTGSGVTSLSNLQATINAQVAKGYRLHTITTTSSGSKGFLGGDKIQATMVFEKVL